MTAVYRHLENELLGVELLGDRVAAVESASDLSNPARPEWMRGTPVLEAEATPIADGNDDDAEEVMESLPVARAAPHVASGRSGGK